MKKNILGLIFAFILLNCQNQKEKTVYLERKLSYYKDNTWLDITFINENKMKFKLSMDKLKINSFENIAELILIKNINGELIVPEGTNRIDYNNTKDIVGIECDSTYIYQNDSMQISIALENITNKRLDFQLELDGHIKQSISQTLLKRE